MQTVTICDYGKNTCCLIDIKYDDFLCRLPIVNHNTLMFRVFVNFSDQMFEN